MRLSRRSRSREHSRPEHSRPAEPSSSWARRLAGRRDLLGQAAILAVAGAVVVGVWVLTGWWSLSEQTGLATLRGFAHPHVLFWGTDAFAVGCALVALAAAVDNRSAPLARVGYALALAGSAYFNAEAAYARLGDATTPDALAMAAGVPLASFAALEIILAAVRATVRRWRGLPAPVGAPALRFGRLLLGGVPELRRWRAAYLDATRPDAVPVQLAEQLREHAAKLAHVNYLQTSALAERLAELRESLPTPTPAPAPDVDQLGDLAEELRADYSRERGQLMAVTVAQRERLTADMDSRLREFARELDSRLAALPRETPAPARPARAARPTPAGDDANDTARMRAHWDGERAAGRTPTGAELDRHVGRDPKAGYGRQLRSRWLAEDEAGVARIPAHAGAGG